MLNGRQTTEIKQQNYLLIHNINLRRKNKQVSKQGVPEVVYVGDFLHTEPAELGRTDRARHVVTRTIVHLDDEGTTARTRLHVGFTTSHTADKCTLLFLPAM